MPETDPSPREKLISFGADCLSETELLALILRTGYKGKTVMLWASELLQKHGGLSGLAELTAADLCGKHTREIGLGPAKSAELLAVLEIGKRIARSPSKQTTIRTPKDADALLLPLLRGEKQEQFVVLSLDVRSCLIRCDTLFIGTLDQALVHPREVYALALRRGAARIIVAHNHPSGDPTPSANDKTVTIRLHEAGKVMGIDLVDHIIVGDGRTISLKAMGVI